MNLYDMTIWLYDEQGELYPKDVEIHASNEKDAINSATWYLDTKAFTVTVHNVTAID